MTDTATLFDLPQEEPTLFTLSEEDAAAETGVLFTKGFNDPELEEPQTEEPSASPSTPALDLTNPDNLSIEALEQKMGPENLEGGDSEAEEPSALTVTPVTQKDGDKTNNTTAALSSGIPVKPGIPIDPRTGRPHHPAADHNPGNRLFSNKGAPNAAVKKEQPITNPTAETPKSDTSDEVSSPPSTLASTPQTRENYLIPPALLGIKDARVPVDFLPAVDEPKAPTQEKLPEMPNTEGGHCPFPAEENTTPAPAQPILETTTEAPAVVVAAAPSSSLTPQTEVLETATNGLKTGTITGFLTAIVLLGYKGFQAVMASPVTENGSTLDTLGEKLLVGGACTAGVLWLATLMETSYERLSSQPQKTNDSNKNGVSATTAPRSLLKNISGGLNPIRPAGYLLHSKLGQSAYKARGHGFFTALGVAGLGASLIGIGMFSAVPVLGILGIVGTGFCAGFLKEVGTALIKESYTLARHALPQGKLHMAPTQQQPAR